MRLIVLLPLLILARGDASNAQGIDSNACAQSPMVRDVAPRDPGADPVGPANWYINASRTIWAGPVPDGGWPTGGTLYSGGRTVKGQKTYWVRPKGTELVITGRRLDGDAPAVEAHVPCCYRSGFQIVGLYFPTEGCWEVTAKAGTSALQFVTLVNRESVGGPR